jgi:diguanylate cyclase (GGDEF)-like protein
MENTLVELDQRLRAKVFADFASWAPAGTKLFYNVDNRIFLSPDPANDDPAGIENSFGLSASRIVLEISERHELEGGIGFAKMISLCRGRGFRIAIDDFGSGYAGLKLLHMSEPDIVKIDRHFVAGSGGEPRKAVFLEKIVGMAHLMGVSVVAEGIETEAELGVCVEAGCDMIQGYLLARPSIGQAAFKSSFPVLTESKVETRRGRTEISPVTPSTMRRIEPVLGSSGFLDVLDRFRKEVDLDILPVVDESQEPVGVYLERDFRPFVYSPFGIALLEHIESGTGASSFLHKAPTAAASADIARLLEVFSAMPSLGGVVLTQDSHYAGLLPAAKLLSLVAEREISEARDQNPLTRLPGNLRVAEVIAQRMAETTHGRAFTYFDFDDFKPFNDHYGFRLGDRIIQLFADILRSVFDKPNSFVGHLGGDDFFSFDYAGSISEALAPVAEASKRFKHQAVFFYSAEDRERGWILGRDRSGEERQMPLIGVSAAVVLAVENARLEPESLSDLFAALKKEAKLSAAHTANRIIDSKGDDKSDKPMASRSTGPAFAVFAPTLLSSM